VGGGTVIGDKHAEVNSMPARTATKERSTTSRSKSEGSLPKDVQRYMDKYGDGLSATAKRAKWITKPDDQPDPKGQTLITRSHDVIQHWAEERDATPMTVGEVRDRPRVLRFDFPGYGGKNLTPIDWDDWFRTFDERNLAFMYQEQLKNGNQSNFFRLDSPEREDG
jgi:hypothetical protein